MLLSKRPPVMMMMRSTRSVRTSRLLFFNLCWSSRTSAVHRQFPTTAIHTNNKPIIVFRIPGPAMSYATLAMTRPTSFPPIRAPAIWKRSSLLPSIISSSSSIMSHHPFLQNSKRNYIYLPLTWSDLKERFLRWVERAEQRALKVRLLNRDSLKDDDTRIRHPYSRRLNNSRTQHQKVNRRKRRPYARWMSNQNRNQAMEHTQFLPLPLPKRNQSLRSMVRNRFQDSSLRYQGWKSRRKEQYQGWRTRRKELYQGWKLRGQEQYQGWRSRRREQYQGWRLRTRQILLQEFSQPEWFDDEHGRPLTSRDATGRFVNPWQSQSTNGIHSIGTVLRWRYVRLKREMQELGWLGKIWSWTTTTAPSLSPLLNHDVPPLPTPTDTTLQYTWIGHSTGLIHVQKDFCILVDPMFSQRAGPSQSLPIGIARDIPPAFTVAELPPLVDLCCITHDHYDHMDEASVKALKDKVQLWVVPLGIKGWLEGQCSIEPCKIVELKWWEKLSVGKVDKSVVVLDKKSKQTVNDDRKMTITCCPASHWGSRTMSDRNLRLWCSFAFSTPNFNFFYCCDTAYPSTFPLFHQIGDELGPFDFCAIPIGAYEPEEMMKDAHCNPKEAVQIHKDLGSQQSVAIHWGSFQLSEEPMDAPPQDLRNAIQEEERESDSDEAVNFSLLGHGETLVIDKAG